MFHSVLTFLAVYTLVISHYLRMHWVLLLIAESKKGYTNWLYLIYCSIKFHVELPFRAKLHIYYFRKDTKLMTKSIIVELKVVIFLLITGNQEFCHIRPPSTTDCLSLV